MRLGQPGSLAWSRREGRLQRGDGMDCTTGPALQSLSFLCICSTEGRCFDFAAPKQRPSKSFSLWVPPRPVWGLWQHLESLGWGGKMFLRAADYGGEGRGQDIALPSLSLLPSPSCTPLGAGQHSTKGFISIP